MNDLGLKKREDYYVVTFDHFGEECHFKRQWHNGVKSQFKCINQFIYFNELNSGKRQNDKNIE